MIGLAQRDAAPNVPSSGLGSGRMVGPGSGNQIIDIWWIAWAPYPLSHAHDPFFSNGSGGFPHALIPLPVAMSDARRCLTSNHKAMEDEYKGHPIASVT